MTENEFLRELVAALTKQNAELLDQVAAANAQIAALTERIDELLEQLDKKNKNSRNSSKPPSSDGYSKPPEKSEYNQRTVPRLNNFHGGVVAHKLIQFICNCLLLSLVHPHPSLSFLPELSIVLACTDSFSNCFQRWCS